MQAWVVGFWRGPADLPDVLCQEWRFTVVRWPAILFVALGLPLAQLQSDQLWQAYGVLVFAGLYNTALTVLLRRQHPLLRGGYVSTALDAIMNLAMINIAGGFETPFYFIIYTVTVAAAMRYGYGASTLMAALFVSCDALSHPLAGRALTDGFFLRSGFLVITGLLAGYLRDQARRAEDALQRRVAELQDAYRDLAGAHEQLKTVDKLKTSFLTNVSHELRTPLTSIRAFGEMLTAYELPREEVHEFGGVITIESERLTRLVNDLLDLSKIEAGQMEWRFEPLDLTEVLRWCGRQIRPVLAAKGVVYLEEFEADLPAVEGDRDRLQQVIANLLHNASKFTPSGSIALCAFADEEALTVEVRDTGIGIPASDLERVFDKFQQVGDTLTDKPHGTGLGLAICRDIINYHNGRIWVESVLGQGSVFKFTMPRLSTASHAVERLAA